MLPQPECRLVSGLYIVNILLYACACKRRPCKLITPLAQLASCRKFQAWASSAMRLLSAAPLPLSCPRIGALRLRAAPLAARPRGCPPAWRRARPGAAFAKKGDEGKIIPKEIFDLAGKLGEAGRELYTALDDSSGAPGAVVKKAGCVRRSGMPYFASLCTC